MVLPSASEKMRTHSRKKGLVGFDSDSAVSTTTGMESINICVTLIVSDVCVRSMKKDSGEESAAHVVSKMDAEKITETLYLPYTDRILSVNHNSRVGKTFSQTLPYRQQ